MCKKTKASVKDGRLTIFTKTARTPGVVAFPIETAANGSFEIAAQNDGGSALVFKAGGKKTTEIVAVYDSPKNAETALDAVFSALSRSGQSGVLRVMGGLAKTIGIIVLVLFLAGLVISWGVGAFFGGVKQGMENDMEQAVEAVESDTIPVGVPMPVEEFINKTNGGSN